MPAQSQTKKRRRESQRRARAVDAAHKRQAALQRERQYRRVTRTPLPAPPSPWGRTRVEGPRPSRWLDAVGRWDLQRSLDRLGLDAYETYKQRCGSALRDKYFPGRDHLCEVCGGPGVQVHHRSYARLGRERADDLVGLCGLCHETTHLFVYDRRARLVDAHMVLGQEVARRAPGARTPAARRQILRTIHDELQRSTIERDAAARLRWAMASGV